MRVPDDLIDCVCFVDATWAGTSTAFFLGVPLGLAEELANDQIVIYAVTARHCVSNGAGLADEIDLRLNQRNGGTGTIRIDPADWLLHPTADVAVAPVSISREEFAFRVYPVSGLATAGFRSDQNIGPGDDVFITGLLVNHPGETKIMPIVRVGNIAAMPDDAVHMKTGPDVAALIEARSIGGLSGSPVFLHLPFWRDAPKGSLFVGGGSKATSGGEHRLFGVMHGFYPVGRNDPDGISGGDENLNTGIAVVVLADRVLDLINCSDQQALRDQRKITFQEQETNQADQVDAVSPQSEGQRG